MSKENQRDLKEINQKLDLLANLLQQVLIQFDQMLQRVVAEVKETEPKKRNIITLDQIK